jgi:hypothetical protein
MRAKMSKPFLFHYPLKRKVVRNLRLMTEEVGELAVEGIAYFDASSSVLDALEHRYSVDLDYIRWNGTDIKPVLELSDMLEEIEDAALRFSAGLWEGAIERAA